MFSKSMSSISQKTVAMSSSKAEFYACGKAVKEVLFIVQILIFLEIPPIKLLVEVMVDNVGAIIMIENSNTQLTTLKIKTQALSIGLFENGSSPPFPTLPQTI
jgi:hypothetical protein